MEKIRRAIRKILTSDSTLYRIGSITLDFLYTVKKDGINTWRMIKMLESKKRNVEPPHKIVLRNLNYPMVIRPGTKDASTIINNVIREEYGHVRPIKEPEWMIDAGAYIGDTSAYFLSKFSNLKVIALEPNPESYEMATFNLQPYGERATLLKKGLFSNEQRQRFSGDNTGASITTSGFEIECTTIQSLLEHFAIPYLDILKIDIEGAEEAIFSSNPEAWLKHVGLLIIEIHGHHLELLISSVLNKNGFSMKRYRSVWYCWQDAK